MAPEDEGVEVKWPNQVEPLDGVVPTNEVSQDPFLFAEEEN